MNEAESADAIEGAFDPDGAETGASTGPGEYLRQQREARRFTVQRAAMATRISAPFIEALEEEDYEALPGKVFARGFIRSLCKAYQTDAADMLERFEASWGQTGRNDLAPSYLKDIQGARRPAFRITDRPSLKKLIKTRLPGHYFRRTPLLISTGLALVLLAQIGWFFPSSDGPEQEAATTQETGTASPAAIPDPPVESSAVPAKSAADTAQRRAGKSVAPVAAAQNPVPTPATWGESLNLKITVKKPVKVRLRLGAKAWETRMLDARIHDINFDESLQILIFDESAVDLRFNGRQIPNPGKEGVPRRLTFSRRLPDSPGKQKM